MSIRTALFRTGGALDGALARSLDGDALARELQPGEEIGPFRIVREHSRGGMAIVYLAERANSEFQQRVALKWMQHDDGDDFAARMFAREREFVASLEHPGIARLIDGGREPDGAMWFAMEWIDGAPIDRHCRERKLSTAQRLGFVMALCDALAFAHAKLLLHRDIKPANVMVTADGHVKLLDFGVAQLLGQDDPQVARALTLGFASPEQLRGESIGISSDVYQVGLLALILLDAAPSLNSLSGTERTAPDAATGAAIDLIVLRGLPRDLRAVLTRATAAVAADRYPTTIELRADLARYLAKQPVSARPVTWRYRARCFLRRHPITVPFAAAALSALLVLSWRVVVERDTAQREAHQASLEASRARASLDFVSELLKWAKPEADRGRVVTVDEALSHATTQLASALKDQPRARGELLLIFADIHQSRGAFSLALPLAEEAYSLLQDDVQVNVLTRVQAAAQLASLLTTEPQRARSIELARAAIALAHNNANATALETEASITLSWRLSQAGDFSGALSEARRASARAAERLGSEHPITLDAESQIATLLGVGGDASGARALRSALVPRLEAVLGRDHPATSEERMALVNDLAMADDFAAAYSLTAIELEVRARLYGVAHPLYARILLERGMIKTQQGDYAGARKDVQAAIDICLTDGPNCEQRLSSFYERLAYVEELDNRLDAALGALRTSLNPHYLAVRRTADTGTLQLSLARLLLMRKEYEQVPQALAAAEMKFQTLPANHRYQSMWQELSGDYALATGAKSHAKKHFEVALLTLERSPPDQTSEARRDRLRAKLAALED